MMSGLTVSSQHRKNQANRRWAILAAILLVVVVIEAVEYGLVPLHNRHYFDLAEMILYVIVLPLLGLWAIRRVNRSESEQQQAIATLNRHNFFTARLSQTSQWEELAESVAMLPTDIFPSGQSWLFLNDPHNQQFISTLSVSWHSGTKTIEHQLTTISEEDSLPICSLQGFSSLESERSKNIRSYYLPLCDDKHVVGFLKVLLPADIQVNASDAALFDSVVSDILLTSSNILLRNSITSQIALNDNERRRIAQDLHDSLGQNLGYLRLKLDQMTTGDALAAVSTIRQELERMRDIADEAYQQMRTTLDDLQPTSQAKLADALLERAQVIAERGGFQVTLNENGTPATLPPSQKRQVLYICQEALNNIEKHARASQVGMVLDWQEAELSIKILDNGCGFDAAVLEEPGHYGLLIMQERAQGFNGDLKVGSIVGEGTQVTLSIPLSRLSSSAELPFIETSHTKLARSEDQ